MKKMFSYLWRHKVISLLVLVALIGGIYWSWTKYFSSTTTVRYVTGQVTKGTLVTTVSGTGQVSSLNELDIKPLASGIVKSVNVKDGDMVKANQILLTLDQSKAYYTLSQAQSAVATAEADYNKLVSPPTSDLNTYQNAVTSAELSLAKTQNDSNSSIIVAQNAVTTAAQNLKLADGGENSQVVSSAYQDAALFLNSLSVKLEDTLQYVDSILGIDNTLINDDFERVLSTLDDSKLTIANKDYYLAKDAKLAMQKMADNLSVNSSHSDIDTTLNLADTALANMSQLLTDMTAMLNATPALGNLTQTKLDGFKSSISGDRSSINSQYTSLLNQKDALQNAKDSYTNYQIAYDKAVRDLATAKLNAQVSINNQQVALQTAKDNLYDKQNPSADDIRIAKTKLASAQNQLASAVEDYNNMVIRAPFEGKIADLKVLTGDQIGESTSVATLITEQQIAEIPFNETDIVKIKLGQKVNLTFDAVDELTITGEVIQVDTLGTVSSGVVNYNVKIIFDVQDERIKPGMSVSAAIIIDSKTDVLLVPVSAVKTQGETNYVQVLVDNQPQNKTVTVGSSDDTSTEITSGLTEGEAVITQTISSSSSSSSSKTSSSSKSSSSNNLGREMGGIMGGGPPGM